MQLLARCTSHPCTLPFNRSSGCSNSGCLLCQYNPSRLCTRNAKSKYLIDDHLLAKCGAPLRVELVDEQGELVFDGLPRGHQLEVSASTEERHKDLAGDL